MPLPFHESKLTSLISLRVFLQHLPNKTYASTFAYLSPREGPQAKYGLFPSRLRR